MATWARDEEVRRGEGEEEGAGEHGDSRCAASRVARRASERSRGRSEARRARPRTECKKDPRPKGGRCLCSVTISFALSGRGKQRKKRNNGPRYRGFARRASLHPRLRSVRPCGRRGLRIKCWRGRGDVLVHWPPPCESLLLFCMPHCCASPKTKAAGRSTCRGGWSWPAP